jgi:hypothetical protein
MPVLLEGCATTQTNRHHVDSCSLLHMVWELLYKRNQQRRNVFVISVKLKTKLTSKILCFLYKNNLEQWTKCRRRALTVVSHYFQIILDVVSRCWPLTLEGNLCGIITGQNNGNTEWKEKSRNISALKKFFLLASRQINLQCGRYVEYRFSVPW